MTDHVYVEQRDRESLLCDFCCRILPLVAVWQGPVEVEGRGTLFEVESDGRWAACAACHALVLGARESGSVVALCRYVALRMPGPRPPFARLTRYLRERLGRVVPGFRDFVDPASLPTPGPLVVEGAPVFVEAFREEREAFLRGSE